MEKALGVVALEGNVTALPESPDCVLNQLFGDCLSLLRRHVPVAGADPLLQTLDSFQSLGSPLPGFVVVSGRLRHSMAFQ